MFLALSACATGEVLGPESSWFWEALSGGTARLSLDDDGWLEVAAPCAMHDLPPVVARMVTSVQPGGRTVAAARVSARWGIGYRVSGVYGEGDAAHRRTVTLDEAGDVVERSHQVPVADVPAAAASTARARGEIRSVAVVQGAPGEEYYRFAVVAGRHDRRSLEVEAGGRVRREARVLDAEIHASR